MEKIQNNILFGRPFVGTAVLVHKKFAAYCNRVIKAKFHYAILFEAGSKLVADRFEAGSKLVADMDKVWFLGFGARSSAEGARRRAEGTEGVTAQHSSSRCQPNFAAYRYLIDGVSTMIFYGRPM